jgi:hypothetical protein
VTDSCDSIVFAMGDVVENSEGYSSLGADNIDSTGDMSRPLPGAIVWSQDAILLV